MDPDLRRIAINHGPGFGDHGSRVAELSLAAATYLDLTQKEMGRLYFSALIHDVGKTDIDPAVLSKPSPLTDGETAEIQRHPQAGHDRVSDLTHRTIAEAVLCHHERWDGMGYPNGVKGKSIPLMSRIILVADAFDVMTNGRSYRPKLGIQDAGKELAKWSGRQFDPKVVDAFASIDRELLASRWSSNNGKSSR